ncbi:MAG: DUF1003 domain-containing protein [Dermabacter sp.]|nr:DUF1003 domain-containing protein [Dermabacter sp.]
MAERKKRPQLDDPGTKRRRFRLPRFGGRSEDKDAFGRFAERIARVMGTPGFLLGMTVFCAVWLGWNTLMPESAQFDPRALNYTLLTLILSLQASYAAPLLLLAQNRQDDRDRVQAESDRQSNERAHATTDFITREIASLRLAVNDVATRDYVRGELRDLLDELQQADAEEPDGASAPPASGASTGAGSSASPSPLVDHTPGAAHLRDLVREDVRAVLREELAALARPAASGISAASGSASPPGAAHTPGPTASEQP